MKLIIQQGRWELKKSDHSPKWYKHPYVVVHQCSTYGACWLVTDKACACGLLVPDNLLALRDFGNM